MAGSLRPVGCKIRHLIPIEKDAQIVPGFREPATPRGTSESRFSRTQFFKQTQAGSDWGTSIGHDFDKRRGKRPVSRGHHAQFLTNSKAGRKPYKSPKIRMLSSEFQLCNSQRGSQCIRLSHGWSRRSINALADVCYAPIEFRRPTQD